MAFLATGPECAPDTPLSDYHRQYSGFTRRGRRLIYLNAAADALFADERWGPECLERWRQQNLNLCDGGEAFWGVEYDVATHSFWRLRFNFSFNEWIGHCHFGEKVDTRPASPP